MVLDVGRIKHRMDLAHRSVGSNGVAIPSNWRASADGLKNVVWTPESAAAVSYGSNSTDITTVSSSGASSLASRADHYHKGVRAITANGSNSLSGNIDLQAGSNIALGVTGQVITVTSLAAGGTSGGGGGTGITHAYLGYNTIGGTLETMPALKVYAKKITVSAAGLLSSIGMYVDAGAVDSSVSSMAVAVYSDSSGTPQYIIGYTKNANDSALLDAINGAGGNTNPRWLHVPIGLYLTAGDYWIAVSNLDNIDAIRIRYDATGSDRTYTSGGFWFADWGFYTPTTTGNQYSIRASLIT